MSRIRLAMAASGLLYLGAVLAGWANAPFAAWPVFLGIFLLWSVLMRPDEWPREAGRWVEAGVITRAVVATAVLAGLALACLGVGWMLAKVRPLPEVGPWPGVLVSLLGVGVSRLVWNPVKAAGMDAFLEDALRQVEVAAAGRESARRRGEAAEVDSVIGFTADTPADRIEAVMAELAMRFHPGRLVEGFDRLHKGGRMNIAQKRALVMLATEPDQARRLAGHGAPTLALRACSDEAGLVELFLRRYGRLLDAVPEVMEDGPSNAMLRAVEKGFEGQPVASAVRALRERQVRLVQGGGDGGALAGTDERP